jgi:hypothetical protein
MDKSVALQMIRDKEIIAANKQGIALYDRHSKLLYCHYFGWPELDLLMELLEPVAIFSETNTIIASIQDMTRAKGTFTKINPCEDFIPRLVVNGYLFGALVIPTDPFKKFAAIALGKAKSLSDRIRVESNTFNSVAEAESWIFSKLNVVFAEALY